DRLLAWCARWRTNRSRYALTHYIQHLAEAATTAAGTDVGQLVDQLAELVTDSDFHRAYLETTDDLPGLQRDLELALDRVADPTGPLLPRVRGVVLRPHASRRPRLRPESVFDPAKTGRIAAARQRLGLFEADEGWHQVALLLIVWLGAQRAPALASALKS